jgi:nitrogen fixation/metabolism regulation signal transduction histidine kinase
VANSVALGNFEYEISSSSRGEIGELIRGFRYMTDELRKNQDEIALLEREAAWKEMAKQVAHEVKNPLTPMKLSVQHLLSAQKDNAHNLPALTEKILNSLLKQIEILNQTASEFSKFAKMPGFEPHKIEIVSLISEIKDLYTGSPTRLIFATSLSEALINGDESFFKRSIINLIRNAVQAGASSVTLSLSLIGNQYELMVSDNGKGISAENRDKIFEINFTTKATGTGLGLKLTRRFVESAGGSIELLDKKPGTHFRITFPVFND